jgi:hypothetical protein
MLSWANRNAGYRILGGQALRANGDDLLQHIVDRDCGANRREVTMPWFSFQRKVGEIARPEAISPPLKLVAFNHRKYFGVFDKTLEAEGASSKWWLSPF